jgi:hypothetical protein
LKSTNINIDLEFIDSMNFSPTNDDVTSKILIDIQKHVLEESTRINE